MAESEEGLRARQRSRSVESHHPRASGKKVSLATFSAKARAEIEPRPTDAAGDPRFLGFSELSAGQRWNWTSFSKISGAGTNCRRAHDLAGACPPRPAEVLLSGCAGLRLLQKTRRSIPTTHTTRG